MHLTHLLPALLLPLLPTTLARPNPNSQCPSNVGAQALTRLFYKNLFSQPDRNPAADAAGFYLSNITVYDTTPNYPGKRRGTTLPVRGLYATSADEFVAKVLNHRAWPFYGVLGRVDTDGTGADHVDLEMTTGANEGIVAPCFVDNGYDIHAVVLKNYGGRRAGDTVTLRLTGRESLVDIDPDPTILNHRISSVTYSIDWSDWYAGVR